GACSGFHGLVCSGTTSKQIDKESHARPVGYGAMLAEGFVAFIALVTIMIVAQGVATGVSPGTVYGNGIGDFLTVIIGKQYLPFAITFGAMAFSTFVFDTLDVCTRLGRYIVQELVGMRGRAGAILGTVATIALPIFIALIANQGSWLEFWSLFGASNQLLAALTLLSITAWLYQARKRIAFTLLPMLFVLVITLWALLALVYGNFTASNGIDIKFVNGMAALTLIGLAVYLVVVALLKVRKGRSGEMVLET
ncbi:MAG: carbon starvation protein A, partial [Acidobacteriota bacterium]|nr:carbon starvation protein A [Acidobacteriota bacterium]